MTTDAAYPRPHRRAHPATRQLGRAAAVADGQAVGLLDITKPRGNVFLDRLEELLPSRACGCERYRKPTFTKAGAGRPPPRDRHEVRRGHRGARRLRLVHVVQCARHHRSRDPGACPGVFVASSEFVEAAEAQSEALGPRRPAGVRPPPHPGPDRRRDARPGRRPSIPTARCRTSTIRSRATPMEPAGSSSRTTRFRRA